jgi:hypothetical protein
MNKTQFHISYNSSACVKWLSTVFRIRKVPASEFSAWRISVVFLSASKQMPITRLKLVLSLFFVHLHLYSFLILTTRSHMPEIDTRKFVEFYFLGHNAV